MKKYIIFLVVLISCKNEYLENYEDIQKIESGMRLDKVLSLMRNKPIDIERAYLDENLLVYSFASPPAASDYYKVIFIEKDSTVVEVSYGD